MATPQPMQDDSLIRALENEQQYEDTGSDEGLPPVPTEVSHGHRQPGQDTDVETCVSSVTDVLQNADLFVDHMYPTLNAVVEEEESHSNLVLKSLNKNLAPTISTTTTEETQRQQTSQNQQHESSGDMLKSLNENSNHAPTISSFGTATGDTQGQKTLTFQNGQHDSSGDKSLNQSAAKEELQSNEAAVLKAAKMDKDDQASSAASIAGIGSKKPSAVNISDQQQEVQKGQKDQKDLPPKQGKPEANLQSKETATNSINPTSAVGVVESSGSDVQAEMQAPQQQPALIRIHRHPVSFPGAYSIDGIGTSSGIGASNDDGRIVPVPPSTGRAELSNRETIPDGLVRANPVEEDPEARADLMHANPVNLEEQERQQQKRKKQTKTFVFILILVILAGAAIVGAVAGTHKKNPDETIRAATPTPTVYLSVEPSEVPSSAPTGVLDLLLDSLPDYTLASINNGSDTPQWQAWQWLANHQNITFLPEWRKTQLFAMATFFYAFEGENWNPLINERWMDDTLDECLWYSGGFGIFFEGRYFRRQDLGIPSIDPCNDHGKLTSLDLLNLELTGFSPTIPPEITLLTFLSRIVLRVNGNLDSSLNDFLIPRMTQLRYLAYMDLSLNGLVGTLPTEFGLINQLTEFSASANAITGTIPSELGQLTLMRSLQLSANSLVGTLPSELWLLTSLENLNLGSNAAGNYLTGRLPSEIGSLNSLQQLSLSKNLFTGEIPSEYGLLTSLESILLFDNFLSGGLPSEVGTMAMLRHVLIQGNMLSGLLPNELQELTALEWLKLESNNISGGILSELGLLTGLLDLRLGSNQFLGGIPTELGQLLSLQELDLADLMMLTGFVPSEFVLMASLGWLNISGSVGLSGTMPDELCFFQNASCTYIWGTKPCFLGFDCTDQLCGCDCLCSNETSNE